MSVKIIAVGDISFGDYPFCPGFGLRSTLHQEKNPFHKIKTDLEDADLFFGNLETVLSDHNLDDNDLASWELRGAPSSVKILSDTGFNVINIANNHIMQHGERAFNDTCTTLQNNNINIVGKSLENSNGSNPVIINTKGKYIGFLGYAFEEEVHKDIKYKYSYAHEEIIKNDIAALRNKVDIIIISCHWGLEFIEYPSPTTITMAHKIVDWGADLILGHHPHVLQGIEEYKDAVIVYSMGNFLFDMLWDNSFKQATLFSFYLPDSGKVRWEVKPFRISSEYNLEYFTPSENQNFFEHFNAICADVLNFYNGDRERKSYQYYMLYEKLRKKNRRLSYCYFLKNILKIKKRMRSQIIFRSLRNKIP